MDQSEPGSKSPNSHSDSAKELCDRVGLHDEQDRRQIALALESGTPARLAQAMISCLQRKSPTGDPNDESQEPPIVRCPKCDESYELFSLADLHAVTCAFCGEVFAPKLDGELPSDSSAFTVDKFRLIRSVGSGAFGSVWEAYDTELEQTVAIKFPHGTLISATALAKFLNEPKANARLDHKNIVRVINRDNYRGIPFIVSEFVAGGTLADKMRGDNLSLHESIELAICLADALACAHDAVIVHRDLTPRNILIAANGEPKITDFGLAKFLDAEETGLTITHGPVGTPLFMAPEQYGRQKGLDGRADIYALGMILYKMIARAEPFQGSEEDVRQQTRDVEPDSPRKYNPAIPKDVETIVLTCLEKEPAKRYQNAAELRDDLIRFRDGHPILKRPVGRLERAWRFCKRYPVPSSLSAALAIVLLASSVTFAYLWQSTVDSMRQRSLSNVEQLLDAPPGDVPYLLDILTNDADVLTNFEDMVSMVETKSQRQERRLELLRMRLKGEAAPSLVEYMLTSPFEESLLIQSELLQMHDVLPTERLVDDDGENIPKRTASTARYLIAAGLSDHEWFSRKIDAIARGMISHVEASPGVLDATIEAFSSLASELVSRLATLLDSGDLSPDARLVAVKLAAGLAGEDLELWPQLLEVTRGLEVKVVATAVPVQLHEALAANVSEAALAPRAKASLTERELRLATNSFVMLLYWDMPQPAARLLNRCCEGHPEVAFHLPAQLSAYEMPPNAVLQSLHTVGLSSESRQSLVTMLGVCAKASAPDQPKSEVVDALQENLVTTDDAGEFSAALWSLRKWNGTTQPIRLQAKQLMATLPDKSKLRVAENGHLLAAIGPGALPIDPGRRQLHTGQWASRKRPTHVERPFELSLFETTINQFRKFDSSWQPHPKDTNDGEAPVYSISAQQAAAYCNWLSQQAELPEQEWCYLAETGSGYLSAASNLTQRKGFRLPTETEWEYACRLGTATKYFFGNAQDNLALFATCPSNSPGLNKEQVGLRMPGPGGFFDMYGNADEICDDDLGREYPVKPDGWFVTRGGAAGDSDQQGSLNGNLSMNTPDDRGGLAIGFRVCRTIVQAEQAAAGN